MEVQQKKYSKEKVQRVEQLTSLIQRSSSCVLVGFAGLRASQEYELRKRFRAAGVSYQVVKNTLFLKALERTGKININAISGLLKGETGVAFSFEDPSAAAKVVRDFRKENERLVIKGAILEGSVLSPDSVEKELATLPGKEELRATFLATLQAPIQQFLAQVQAPMQHLLYVLEARRRQLAEKG
ncbi:MAG: 50S ribosomal protein L10 [Sandaracinaceae bacterium]|nr:50S ribosomal protein L10 [Sandaracinaceae bacterium]MDW8247233.1 50S ribosomal protein L10 [Sandaracinaceae bacterium]